MITSKLKDLIDLIIDYRGKTPKKLGGDWSESGYRVFSAKNIKTGEIVSSESIRYVNNDLYRSWMKDEIQKGDILITSEAPFGQIYFWDSDEKIVLGQRLFAIRPKKSVNGKYLYYYMTGRDFQCALKARATGTTVTGLRQPELLQCQVSMPSKEQQDYVAHLLGTLDKKIQINVAINDNLFKLTSSEYPKWFYYLWTLHHLDRFITIAADKATTMGHIKRGDLAQAEVIIPSNDDINRIGEVISPIVNLIIVNKVESRKMAALRDEMLIKLIANARNQS